MPMQELDVLRAHLEEVELEIEQLEDLAKAIREQIAVMAADASGNTHWGPADNNRSRQYLPFLEIAEEFADSDNRALRMFANMKEQQGGNMLTNRYVVALTPEGDEELMEDYARIQSGLIGSAILGKTFALAIMQGMPEDVRMPWWVNHPPHQAREMFEERYSPASLRDKLAAEAERNARVKDFYFKMAQWTGNEEEFLLENPGYEPA